MPINQSLELLKEFLFPRRYESTSIPPLDGGMTPNNMLEELATVASGPIPDADDVVLDHEGRLYVSSGHTVLRLSGTDFVHREVFTTVDGEAGALALAPDGALLVAVAGRGVVRVEPSGTQRQIIERSDDGVPVRCVTSMAVAADGTVHLTDGSTRHQGQEWARDLMERNSAGRLLLHRPATGRTQVVKDGLAYPTGVTLTADGTGVVVTEAWRHRITVWYNNEQPTVLRGNLPGYPGRISPAPGGGYWLSIFALRTLLVEFLLTQRDYVGEMMRTIEPEYWVRPALRTLDSGLEPVQGGQIRKLGVLKPWAPPRSYGLVVRLDADGHPLASMHSRSGGRRHGITSARQYGGSLFIACRGGNQVLLAPEVQS